MSRPVDQVNNEDFVQDTVDYDTGGLFTDGGADNTDNGNWPIPPDDELIDATAGAGGQQPAVIPGASASAPVVDTNVREVRLPTGHVLRGTPDEIIAQQQNIIARQSQQRQYDNGAGGNGGGGNNGQYQNQGWREPIQQDPQRGLRTWDAAKRESFFKDLATSPELALHNYLREYLGVDDPAAAFDKSYSISTQVSDRIAVADFLSNNADFPQSNESAAVILQRVNRDGVDLNAWNLEVAYRQLVREGALAPVTPAAPGQQQQTPVQQQDYRGQYQQGGQQPTPTAAAPAAIRSRGAGAPPAIPGGPAPTQPANLRLTRNEFDSLSLPEQRAYITRHTIPARFLGGQ